MFQLPNGALISIAASYGPVKQMTAVTNAALAVATLEATHGVVVGDIFEITSGWSRITNKIVRASLVATNDVTIEGINTLSTAVYPAGTGIGSIREILTWTQLAQVLTSSSSGGDQQFLTVQTLSADAAIQMPTFKNPSTLTLKVADDPNLLGYQLASAANDDRLPRAVQIALPGGAKVLMNAYISVGKIPAMDINQLMSVEVTMSLLAEVVRYPT